MQIRKKNGQLVNNMGQLEPEPEVSLAAVAPPEEIPEIVERYVKLVGKVVASMEAKTGFQNKDVNAIASLGRSVAMLQAVEEARAARHGNKSLNEMTKAELKALAEGKTHVVDARFEEKTDE